MKRLALIHVRPKVCQRSLNVLWWSLWWVTPPGQLLLCHPLIHVHETVDARPIENAGFLEHMPRIDVGGGAQAAVEGMRDFEGIAELVAMQVAEGDAMDEEFCALKPNYLGQYQPKVRSEKTYLDCRRRASWRMVRRQGNPARSCDGRHHGAPAGVLLVECAC